jgi:tRNA(Ile)-lysidine synthase
VTLAPGGNLQARAREVRYAALAAWAEARGLIAVLTAHHADDQAETLLMRLARGAGPSGLCGIRERTLIEGANGRTLQLLRPLLGWRKQELVRLVAEAGIAAADDPSNRDRRHRRAHARQLLAEAPWIDPVAVAASASHLADAEEALSYAAEELAEVRVMADDRRVTIDAADLPRELQRRLLLLAFDRLRAPSPRGPDLDRALACLAAGRTCTLSGLRLSGGEAWTIAPAPPRRAASGQ